ncbi:GDP-L-fucose synthase family protein [Helicobacter cappadocius]|uniref:GDP-L-fucose synthase n=1 Tax=Helicobacter cappadocius TaxID=3063998 RepID=A0AA90PSI8_9HELI|nr:MULTISPECIES: GDP-L-fucose synthase [unclassified Helicobacter]MDO7253784.1 GDP-L-fucose synthase [Helicobacter sp. faydin-H75]MDP2538664.1 GDP-L-fucose synthase [Helicobacter sp. faydin-H76]
MKLDSKIFVAGHNGLVGTAIKKALLSKGYQNLVLKTRSELDLSSTIKVEEFFQKEKPEYVFLAAAKVGGIIANNTYRADFIYENLMIQNNIIYSAYKNGVKKLLFLGSSCIYPKNAPQPIKEEYLLTDTLEYTNEPYAIAKIAGLKMCEAFNLQYGCNFISVMPTNLYGENDNFDLNTSHVLPALIRKFYEGKLNKSNSVEVWGSGNPRREFLHSSDMAQACIYIMENINFNDLINNSKEIRNTHINIGYGSDVSIKELATLIKNIVGFDGEIIYDKSKPDGTYQKLLDTSKLNSLGWKPKITLEKGVKEVFEWYINQKK